MDFCTVYMDKRTFFTFSPAFLCRSRNSVGLIPLRLRNTLEKVMGSLYPTSSAMSPTGLDVEAKRDEAFSMR